VSAGIYPMKRISDYFNHDGNKDVEAMVMLSSDVGLLIVFFKFISLQLPEIQELEKHWTSIADKLAKLQADIAAVKGPTPLTVMSPPVQSVGEFVDLVVRANPSKPPHSLPLVKEQLEKRLGLKVFAKTHVHSAVAQDMTDDSLRRFISSDPKLERSNAQLAITLIWTKGDEEVSLMVSPSSQSVAVRSESNLARFILRRYPALLDYEGSDLHRTAQLDHLLDLSELIIGSNKKERAAALKLLDKPTSVSVTGANQLNAVDFVLYSAVVNTGAAQEVGQHCRAWLDRCRGSPISPVL